jgi:hypothetical protein
MALLPREEQEDLVARVEEVVAGVSFNLPNMAGEPLPELFPEAFEVPTEEGEARLGGSHPGAVEEEKQDEQPAAPADSGGSAPNEPAASLQEEEEVGARRRLQKIQEEMRAALSTYAGDLTRRLKVPGLSAISDQPIRDFCDRYPEVNPAYLIAELVELLPEPTMQALLNKADGAQRNARSGTGSYWHCQLLCTLYLVAEQKGLLPPEFDWNAVGEYMTPAGFLVDNFYESPIDQHRWYRFLFREREARIQKRLGPRASRLLFSSQLQEQPEVLSQEEFARRLKLFQHATLFANRLCKAMQPGSVIGAWAQSSTFTQFLGQHREFVPETIDILRRQLKRVLKARGGDETFDTLVLDRYPNLEHRFYLRYLRGDQELFEAGDSSQNSWKRLLQELFLPESSPAKRRRKR